MLISRRIKKPCLIFLFSILSNNCALPAEAFVSEPIRFGSTITFDMPVNFENFNTNNIHEKDGKDDKKKSGQSRGE